MPPKNNFDPLNFNGDGFASSVEFWLEYYGLKKKIVEPELKQETIILYNDKFSEEDEEFIPSLMFTLNLN